MIQPNDSAKLGVGSTQQRRQSLLGTARSAIRKLLGRERPAPPPHPFDEQFQVDTSGLIDGSRLGSAHRHDGCNTAYWGIAPSVLEAALRHCATTSWSDYSFIDLGSGKGRALMLAAKLPFKEVVGVELSPELHAIAERNLQIFQKSGQVRSGSLQCVRLDATEVDLPERPCVVFLFNPFKPPVLDIVVERIAQSYRKNPRPIFLIYVHPEFRASVESVADLEVIFDGEFPLSAEDAAVNAFGTRLEQCAIFRFIPPRAA